MKGLLKSKKSIIVISVILLIGLFYIINSNGLTKNESVVNIKETVNSVEFNKTESNNTNLSKGEQINKRLEDLTKVCENIKNSYECAKAIEEQEIEKYPDLVRREGSRLILKMDDGSEVVYEDIRNKNDITKNKTYLLQMYIPEINSYLLYGGYYEYRDMFYINKKGNFVLKILGEIPYSKYWLKGRYTKYWFSRPFLFNRKADKFITYSCNLDGLKYGFDIINYREQNFFKEYSNNKIHIIDASWINENLIKLVKCSYNAKENERVFYLRYEEGKWTEFEKID